MDRHRDELMADLKRDLLRMSALAEAMIADAVKLVVDRDASVVAAVQRRETEVNRFQLVIDETCLTLIALHQPAAGDLRYVLGAVKTNAELERLADQAVNICDKGERLLAGGREFRAEPLARMAAIARSMLTDSLHAYVNRNVALARDVLARDDEVDALKKTMTEDWISTMRSDPESVAWGVAMILIARNMERIGDHATNIAENAIFVAEGRDIRHGAREPAQPPVPHA